MITSKAGKSLKRLDQSRFDHEDYLQKGSLKRMAGYGNQYREKFLTESINNREVLEKDWYEGLHFFFTKSFYRGRRDEISDVFRERALQVMVQNNLRDNLPGFDGDSFDKLLVEGKVNNGVDRKMVCQTIEFISNLPKNNLITYALSAARNNHVPDLFSELTSIYGIGDKLAAFFLRDLAIIYGLEDKIAGKDLIYFQPVDTWVRQVASAIKIADEKAPAETIKKAIIEASQNSRVSSLLVNAGAWYLGSHSFKILVSELEV